MALTALITTFPWTRYSKKLAAKIERARSAGFFTAHEAEARDVKLASGRAGTLQDGNTVQLYWLVDKDDGIIIDAKFQVFGQSVLIGAAEVACELLVGKNYDQAKRVTATLLDQQIRDKTDQPAFPIETTAHLNLVVEAIHAAAEQCQGIPLAATYTAPPVPIDIGDILEGGYPGWLELSQPEKLSVIEQVLDRDVRPYIALDAGGIDVKELINDRELIIVYQGSCTSCYSSIGTTLTYIQQILRAKVHPHLIVTPDLENTRLT